jgi:phage tail sheath gpL-like
VVAFNEIADNLRVPFAYFEISNAEAQDVTVPETSLLVGQHLAASPSVEGVIERVLNAAAVAIRFGRGSILHRMAIRYFQNDPNGEVYAVGLDDAVGGVPAQKTITVTGPATGAGTIYLRIGGDLVTVGVADADAATAIAAAINAAINLALDLPVTSTVALAVVTTLARNDGTLGEGVLHGVNFLGAGAGEVLPPGVGIAIAVDTTGATDPVVTPAITGMSDTLFDYVVDPFVDTAALNAFETEYDQVSGRWVATRQIYGGVWTANEGTQGTLSAFGDARNDPAISCAGLQGSPSPKYEVAAAYAARSAASLRNLSSQPLQTLPLVGIVAPAEADRWQFLERQALLYDGISPLVVRAGKVTIDQSITMYQRNTAGQEDSSYLFTNARYQLMEIVRRMRSAVQGNFPRHVLVDNGTLIGPGIPATTPDAIASVLIATYDELEAEGVVEGSAAFAEALLVVRHPSNKNRVEALIKPDLANQFRIFAALVRFLQ